MSIRWDSESDWKNNQDSSGTTGRGGDLRQGYSRDRPDLSQDLVGYWPLHDSSAIDYSGNGNHGSLSGGVTTGVAGKGGLQAMSLDGNDDYISINSSYRHQGPFTWCAWVKRDSTDTVHTVIHDRNGAWTEAKIFFQIDSNNHISFNANIDGNWRDLNGTTTISAEEWYHLAVTYNGSKREVYVNGVSEGTLSDGSMENKQNSGDAAIGRQTYDNVDHFDGNIFDVRFYSRALSDSEIQTLYEWGSADLARPETDGVSRYALDGDATDSWGSNDGTNNGATFVDDAIRGQAAEFVASENDYIDIPDQPQRSAITVSIWAKPLSSESTLTELRQNMSFLIGTDTNNDFRFGVYDGSSWTFITSSGKTEWCHLTGVYNNGNMKFYINGFLVGTASASSSGFGDPDRIGAGGWGGNYTDGLIDDVRVYDYALEPWEVFELYRWGTRGKDLRKDLVRQ